MNENDKEVIVEMTAGEMLRNARTTGRRKREISTVAKQLCIREEFLQALEDGNYTAIPEVVYILGFARNYAMELGLDPDEIIAKIKREMGLDADCSAASPDDNHEDSPSCVIAAKSDVAKQGIGARVWKYIQRNWIWFVGAVIALVALVIALVVFLPNGESNAETENNANVQMVVTETEPNYNAAVRERFGTENRESADVVLQAIQESWVKIEDGRGNTVFSRVLVPGDVYYVPNGDKYKATFGNAGGVDVWVNGKLTPKVGENHVRKSGISMSPDALMAVK